MLRNSKNLILPIFPILPILLLAIFLCSQISLAGDLSYEDSQVNNHIAALTSNSLSSKINAAKIISRSSYQSTKLFDVVEKELLDNYPTAFSREGIEYVSWLCKALSASGMERYRPTLEKVAQTTHDAKLKRHATQSLERLSENAYRVKAVTSHNNAKKGRDPEVSRLMNMLQTNTMNLKRDAAKIISKNIFSDPDLYKTVNDELLSGYQSAHSKNDVDTMAWLCKALARSTNPEHKKTLETIAADANNRKIRKYAKKSLKMMAL